MSLFFFVCATVVAVLLCALVYYKLPNGLPKWIFLSTVVVIYLVLVFSGVFPPNWGTVNIHR